MPLSDELPTKLNNVFQKHFFFYTHVYGHFTSSFCHLLVLLFGILLSVLVASGAWVRRRGEALAAWVPEVRSRGRLRGSLSLPPPSPAPAPRLPCARAGSSSPLSQAHSDCDVTTACPFMSLDMVDGHCGHMASYTRRDQRFTMEFRNCRWRIAPRCGKS